MADPQQLSEMRNAVSLLDAKSVRSDTHYLLFTPLNSKTEGVLSPTKWREPGH